VVSWKRDSVVDKRGASVEAAFRREPCKASSGCACLKEDARCCFKRTAQGDEPACLRQVDLRVVGQDRGAGEVETETDELVMAPDTGSLRVFRLVKVGRQLDLLGLIHVSFLGSTREAIPVMGHPAHFAVRGDPFVHLAGNLSTVLRRPRYSSGSNGSPRQDELDSGAIPSLTVTAAR
jgi:hypothetical protein